MDAEARGRACVRMVDLYLDVPPVVPQVAVNWHRVSGRSSVNDDGRVCLSSLAFLS